MKTLTGEKLQTLEAEAKRILELMRNELHNIENEDTKLILSIVQSAADCALYYLAGGSTYDQRVVMDSSDIAHISIGNYPCLEMQPIDEDGNEELVLIENQGDMDQWLEDNYPDNWIYE